MNATKRKFNALLQGLGTSHRPTSSDDTSNNMATSLRSSAASETPATTTSNESLLQKRRRLGLQGAPTLAGGGLAAAKPSTTNIAVRRWGSHIDNKPKDRNTASARYSPADRQELLRRLATFQELTDWTPKPEPVSEIEWAKRGWVCQAKERVRCVLCHKELVVKLNRKEVDGKEVAILVPSEVEDALVSKYAELIVASHQEDCLWRKRGCDDSLLRLSLASATASLAALRLRYDELCARKSFLPYEFNLRLPEDMKLDEVLSQLPTTFFTHPAPTEDIPPPAQSPNRVAFALALLGWQGLSNSRIGAVPNSASCHTCLRRLGLWMFKSKEVDDDGEVLVPAPMDHLDPIREHRFFCPWKSAEAQSRDTSQSSKGIGMPAWKVLLQTIANEAHLQSVYDGRPKTKVRPGQGDSSAPSTPTRGRPDGLATPGQGTPGATAYSDSLHADAGPEVSEDEAARESKDKERWARLRRVKSLFESKSGKKLRRPLSRPGSSRPGTSQSTLSVQEKE